MLREWEETKSQSFYVVASSKEQPLPLQLWFLTLWSCVVGTQKLKQRNDAVSQGLKNISKSSKDSHLPTSYSSDVKLPDNFPLPCSWSNLAWLGGFVVFFVLNWWIREESPGKIICLHLFPISCFCFRSSLLLSLSICVSQGEHIQQHCNIAA